MSLRILLADDSMTAQNMGKKILTDGGYAVVTVSNGAAAIKKLAEFTPDIIIADVYMPGYNGLEICERVKKAAATAAVPVLLSVGKLEPFRPEEGLKVHADGIIIKPFEATDLLAVTAKLAERAGKRQAPAPEPEAEPESASVQEVAAEPPTPEPQVPPTTSHSANIPAFSMDELTPPPTWEEQSAPAVAAFALHDHQPEYVREFGLDPHDAPTTTIKTVRDFAPSDSFVEQLPDFAASQPTAELSPDLAPVTANLVINEVSLPEPDVLEEPVASVPTDDFEAKLAAAMAEYEAPVAEHEPEFESHAEVMPNAVTEAVSSAWVAQEAPLSENEVGVSLEDELRAFAASASASAATLAPAPQVAPVAPSGPMGDTSFDDEVSALVEASKEQFFPAPAAAETVASEAPSTEADPFADESTFTDRVNALLDDAGFAPATDAESLAAEFAPTAFEPVLDELPESAIEVVPVSVAAETVAPVALEVSEVAPELPELMTHDIASDWSPVHDAAEDVAADTTPELIDVETVPAEINATEDYLLTPQDFVSPEAPFAHAAVDEVAEEQPITDEQSEALTQQIAEAVAPQITEQVAPEIAAATEAAVEQSTPTAPALDEAAIADVVQRVMDRMRGDIISQIARELAAKLGK